MMVAQLVPTERHRGLRSYLDQLLPGNERLTVVSNRGPLSFAHSSSGEWSAQRGSGGLVTALAELGRLAPVTWISGALGKSDREAAEALDGDDDAKRREVEAAIDAALPG